MSTFHDLYKMVFNKIDEIHVYVPMIISVSDKNDVNDSQKEKPISILKAIIYTHLLTFRVDY